MLPPGLSSRDEGVAAVTTVKDVIADGGANGNEGVVAITTALVVAAWTADDPVIAGAALEEVIALFSVEEVVTFSPMS